MAMCAFTRLFEDNGHYEQFEKIPFIDSLAYVVQEYLYTEISKEDNNYLYLNRRIRLYDFMTMVAYFIGPSIDDLGKTTIKDYIADLYENPRLLMHLDNVEYTKKGLSITNASDTLVISILWAAFIYAKASYKIFKEKVWETAFKMLYDLMVEEWGPCEEDDDKLEDVLTIKRSEEAVDLMIWHIRKKIKEEETIEDNTKKTAEKQETHLKSQTENQPSDDQNELIEFKRELEELSNMSSEEKLAIDERIIFFSSAVGLDFDPKRTNQNQLAKMISVLSGDAPASIRGRISKMNRMERENNFTDEVMQAARNVIGMLEKVPQGNQPQKLKDIIENIETVFLN